MMFSVCGSRTEMMGDRHNAYSMYIETLSLIKFLTKLTNSSRNNNQDVDPRYSIAYKSFLIDIDISELITIMIVVHNLGFRSCFVFSDWLFCLCGLSHY